MGRAQVKFRATHGRGRGRGSGPPRGRGTARGGSSGGRQLGSNAFRYEEREADEQDVEEDEASDLQPSATGRRQFFADEKSYRPVTGATKGSYFQSRTVQQWEADEACGDEDGSTAFGVLDFGWFAEQLATISPAVRYRMDPKDCVDFAFEPVHDQAAAGDLILDEDKQEYVPLSTAPSKADEAALDSLLELSVSMSTAAGARVAGGLASSSATSSTSAVSTTATSQAQMEDWLDDVLDM